MMTLKASILLARLCRAKDVDIDEAAKGSTTPRSILSTAKPLSDVGNVLRDGTPAADIEFQPLEGEADQAQPNATPQLTNDALPSPTKPKQRRPKKQVRVLLDARTELTDQELRDARDNYLAEQARLRQEMEQSQMQKNIAERAHELLFGPPDIRKCHLLILLWLTGRQSRRSRSSNCGPMSLWHKSRPSLV